MAQKVYILPLEYEKNEYIENYQKLDFYIT